MAKVLGSNPIGMKKGKMLLRPAGIEPAAKLWKSSMLPLHHERLLMRMSFPKNLFILTERMVKIFRPSLFLLWLSVEALRSVNLPLVAILL